MLRVHLEKTHALLQSAPFNIVNIAWYDLGIIYI